MPRKTAPAAPLVSDFPGERAYRQAVTAARKAWSLLAGCLDGEAHAAFDLACHGPMYLASRVELPELLDRLVRSGCLQVHREGPRTHYRITEAGRELHGKLDRWMHYEGGHKQGR